MRNAKYAPRGASGKVVTVYPTDEAACERILAELDAMLDGAPGPYILSDLRYGTGPLYVRYGGFTERYCPGPRGEMVPAIENPAGELVPDPRSPVFTVPPWVRLPGFLAPHLAARNSMTIAGLPYEVEQALHFSNGGGVYAAVDKRTGERVILKEARPHAGLAADGSDAVARLRREHDILRRLSGLGLAPEVRGYFEIGEHHFLAEEFIEGQPLNSCYAERYPLTAAEPDPAKVAAYTAWALQICAGIERAADAMHEHGVIFNDLHMFNIMIRPDDTVALIDFEAASYLSEGKRRTVGNPGFAAPGDLAGFGIDDYSTACIRLAMFMPLTTLFALDRSKAAQVATVIAEHFPVPAEFLDQAVREITGHAPTPRPLNGAVRAETMDRSEYGPFYGAGDQAWGQLRAALVGAIRSSATPSRDDRHFPGDIEQFAAPGGGLGIAHGPAGVVWTLSRLGHADAALRAADMCLGDRWERLGSDLYGGLAGFSLTMLALGDSEAEPSLVDAGLKAAGILADRPLGRGNDRERAAGLLRGASGQGLLFVRLYERTADPAYLDAAEASIAADLDRCVTDRRGSLQVDDGWRILPYVGAGSAGIGMVIDRFGGHRQSAAFAEAAAKIRIGAQSAFYAQAGLFSGRAGMILYLAGQDRRDQHVVAQVRRLAWHAIRYEGGLAFPGDMLLRLSMDLGTGTAGVLLALAAALAPEGAAMPFLGPPVSLPGGSVQGSLKERVIGRR